MFSLHCAWLISCFLLRNRVFSGEIACIDPNFKLFTELDFWDIVKSDGRDVYIDEPNNFNCPHLPPSKEVPSSVHALRPGDIKVIAALGDSLSAANGAGGDRLYEVYYNYRGLSFSAGGSLDTSDPVVGDANDVNEHFSLPNVFKFYNPGLLGWSHGVADPGASGAQLNMAVAGSKAYDLHSQAKNLIEALSLNHFQMNKDWKLLNIFIGGNNLCQFCTDPRSKPEEFVKDIQGVLDKLKENVPRMFVNLLTIMDVDQVARLGADIKTCQMAHVCFCECMLSDTPANKTKYQSYLKQYRSGLKDLVNSGRYDTSDDFTVVVQPTMEDVSPPLQSDGTPDLSYMAPDCFHFSQRGHNMAGRALWNSMLQPVGSKSPTWDKTGLVLCPSEEQPFLATSKNSGGNSKEDQEDVFRRLVDGI